MKRSLGIGILVVCLVVLGCGEKKVSEESLPKAEYVGKTIRDFASAADAPTDVLYEFRLTLLNRYDWKGKALRVKLVTQGEMPLYSLTSMPDPGDEVTLLVTIDKKPESEDVSFKVVWAKSKDGKMDTTTTLGFPNSTKDLRRAVVVSGTGGLRVTQIVKKCGAPGKPVVFDPEKGVELLSVGKGECAWHLEVWAAAKDAGG